MTNKLSPNQRLFQEIHTSIFFVLTVIHHCASLKKIFTGDLNNQELDCLGPIWGENDSFGPNENFLEHSYMSLFSCLLLGPHHQANFIKNPASTFENREMHCCGLKWGKNGPFGSNGKFKYIHTYIVTYTLAKQ